MLQIPARSLPLLPLHRIQRQTVERRHALRRSSPNGALRSRVVDAGEAVDDGYGCGGLRLFRAASPVGRLPQFQRISRIYLDAIALRLARAGWRSAAAIL